MCAPVSATTSVGATMISQALMIAEIIGFAGIIGVVLFAFKDTLSAVLNRS
ncbi:hypothetical protein Metvu_0465 [Methanocaldococcus vulcanius M7]|uniref:Uncharacterized protein n=1 Tax=Methanocaldococcus vulcanius (strain ATCC 700851 / DSM 12094 / M7) TaxID=579137 RepID=C9RFH2_METVM|nr:hypothetical protein [Methanocaldococcus vulcanius]ACX72324.1 hypothetical protein Metvu_0465 [Methanocaldococcus vulcanius M7]